MNPPLRRLGLVVVALFVLLIANAQYVQGIQARSLNANPANGRQLLERYNHERGDIVVQGQRVALSTATDGTLVYQRSYPAGPEYAAVTGYEALTSTSGIESFENEVLNGSDDRFALRNLSDQVFGRTRTGGRVTLTLSKAAQDAAWAAMQGRTGAVVALDPRTGAILALVSTPSFDPNRLATHDSAALDTASRALVADPAMPLLDRATQQSYPPGSLFKIVTGSAALTTGNVTPDSTVPAPDAYRLPGTTTDLHNFANERCGDGQTDTLVHSFTISCNTTFASLAVTTGLEQMQRTAAAFGIGSVPPAFGLPVAASTFPAKPNDSQLALSGIGQFDVSLTPLQACMVVAAVANKGVLTAPYLVDRVQAPDLSVLDATEPRSLGQAVSPSVAAQMTTMMESVVTSGTGTPVQIPGVRVAGKTGTAQTAAGQDPRLWFGGFAPADNPRVAVVVLLEDGGTQGGDATGGVVAGPIARAVLQAALGDPMLQQQDVPSLR